VSDDWLQHGHEIDSAELTTVMSSSGLLRAVAPPRRRFTWRAVVTGGAVALLATLGVVGVANALGDNLFPSLGPTSPASVWLNPVPATEPEPDDVAATTVPTTTAPATTSPVPTTAPASPNTAAPTTAVAPGAVAPAPTTSDPRRDDDDDDVAVTTLPAGSNDDDDDGSSSGSGSSGNSGSGSSGSGSDDSSDDD
jgi:uncharacterized membrane protein YgcG